MLITSHTILVNDGNLNKMQMATKRSPSACALCWMSNEDKNTQKKYVWRVFPRKDMPFLHNGMLKKVVREEKFKFNEFFMTEGRISCSCKMGEKFLQLLCNFFLTTVSLSSDIAPAPQFIYVGDNLKFFSLPLSFAYKFARKLKGSKIAGFKTHFSTK
jgi:hypothetical protein